MVLIISDVKTDNEYMEMEYAVASIIPSERWVKLKARIGGRLQPPILFKRNVEVTVDTEPFERGLLVKEYIVRYKFKRRVR
jgi:hypothetical protein